MVEVEAEGGVTGVGKGSSIMYSLYICTCHTRDRGGCVLCRCVHWRGAGMLYCGGGVYVGVSLCRCVHWRGASMLYCGEPFESLCGRSRSCQCGADVGPDVP